MTVQDVLDALNAASEKLTASFSGGSIVLTDTAGGGGDMSVVSINGTTTAENLGLTVAGSGASLTGATLSLASVFLKGLAGNDVLTGTGGDDLMIGGEGADSFTGNGGVDTIWEDLSAETGAVTVTFDAAATPDELEITYAGDGSATVDSLLDTIERLRITGSSFADTINLSQFTGSGVIETGGGGDSLIGGSGDDEFWIDVSNITPDTSAPLTDQPVEIDNNQGGDDQVFLINGDGTLNQADVTGYYKATTPEDLDLTVTDGDLQEDIAIDAGSFSIASNQIKTNGYDLIATGTSRVNITLTAETPKTKVGWIKTGVDLRAGNEKNRTIDVASGTIIDAVSTNGIRGDVTIEAIDDLADFSALGFANVDINTAKIDIGAARIEGRDVTINAVADTIHLSKSDSGGWGDFVGRIFSTFEAISVLVGVSVAIPKATIDLNSDDATSTELANDGSLDDAGLVIEADDLFVESSAGAKVYASSFAWVFGLSVGVIASEASVTVGKSQITTLGGSGRDGDVRFRATSDNILDVVADVGSFESDKIPDALKQTATAIAVSVNVPKTEVDIRDDANLVIADDLFVQADSEDYNRTLGRAITGDDGKLGIAISVSVEDGDTNAFLDGNADVTGNVNVSATMARLPVEKLNLWVLPGIANGTAASAGVGSSSTGEIEADIRYTLFSGFTELLGKAFSKIKGSSPSTPDEVERKDWQAAGAIAVEVDINNVEARIGKAGGAVTDVQSRDGAVSLTASASARPDVTAGASVDADRIDEDNPPKTFSGSTITGDVDKGRAGALYVGWQQMGVDAYIEDARVDAQEAITVNAIVSNDIDPAGLWGVNLAQAFAPIAKLKSTDQTTTLDEYAIDGTDPRQYRLSGGVLTVQEDDIVEVAETHTAGGETGQTYRYIGVSGNDITLADEDYSDARFWAPVDASGTAVAGNATAAIFTYLDDNMGLDNNLIDAWGQATARGQEKLSFALSAGLLVLTIRPGPKSATVRRSTRIARRCSRAARAM